MSQQPNSRSSRTGFGFLDGVEWLGNRLPDPAILFVILALAVIGLSHLATVGRWSVQPQRLVPITEPVLDAAGDPVLDASGNPRVQPAHDEKGRPKLELKPVGDPVRPRSLLTGDGLYWAISSMVDNFVRFPPLGIVLVGMLGVGVAEKCGLIGAALKALMLAVPRALVTPTVIFLGVMSSLGTDAGYIVLPPVAAALYKSLGRSPLAGIAAAFAGVAGGFNANLLVTSLDPLLAGLTGPAAQTIEPGYAVNPAANLYFMIVSTFLISLVGWFTADFIVERRLRARPPEDGGPVPADASDVASQRLSPREIKGLWGALGAVVVVLGVFGAMRLTPRGPLDDVMRHADLTPVARGELIAGAVRDGVISFTGPVGAERTREMLAGFEGVPSSAFAGVSPAALLKAISTPARWTSEPKDDAERQRREATFRRWLEAPVAEDPKRLLTDAQRNGAPGTADHFARWAESIVPILFLGFLAPGVVFGVMTGQFRRAGDVVQMMVGAMVTMAPVIVLAFFAAQFIEYFKYSGLDRMLAYAGGTVLAKASLGPSALIVAFICVTMLVNLLIASMSAKYSMFAPIFVPMLMLVGISPELTQCAYRIGDSVTNIITPLNSYLIIILAVVQRYAPKGGMGTIISMMMPFTITFLISWTLLMLAWMALGLPLGPGAGLWYTPGH
ncbi:MAG: AbgT family transporter [Phycisphaerales bacterium]|nr:AbgT family transporter [Phycisphaerales bacterium]